MGREALKQGSEVRALVRRAGRLLIIKPACANAWSLPGGRWPRQACPMETLAKHCYDLLDLAVRIDAAVPPFRLGTGAGTTLLRVYLCSPLEDQPDPVMAGDARWVVPGQLSEYFFDWAMQPVLAWLASGSRR